MADDLRAGVGTVGIESGAATLSGGAGGGALPSWGPWVVIGGCAMFVAAVLVALGSFTVAALLVVNTFLSVAALYAWSRIVEGARRAKDRLMTMSIVAAFALAVTPLVSL